MQAHTKQKILLVITKSNFGGAQRYVYELATHVNREKFEVAVASGGQGELIERLKAAGIPHYPISSLHRDIGLVAEFRSLLSLATIIRSYDPDVIHLNSAKAGALGALVARLLGVPRIIFTAHGWSFREDRTWLWKTIVYMLSWLTGLWSHHIITVSDADWRDTPTKLLRSKATTIHLALSDFVLEPKEKAREILLPNAPDEKKIWLGTIAELTPNKNLTSAITTIHKYNQTHNNIYRYVIIGDGEQRHALEKLIKNLGGEDSIHLSGSIPEARRLLSAFDVFLLPSKKEGFPYALLEAGHASLPLIASDVGGVAEIVEHDKEGYLIDPYNLTTLQEALDRCEDGETRRHLGTAAYAKVTQWDMETMVRKTEAVYVY